ncbi:COA8 family protein CG14806, mitochondrial [Hetaerina americana]|uniref:COA8 family protein CG14806, mitochondrial n=1 Tax=Hetaerina americana TaxID=62018 RepID=UPI003A7F3B43
MHGRVCTPSRLCKSHNLWVLSVSGFVSKSFSTKIEMHDPKKIKSDLIGPPDPVSNLRPLLFKISETESILEKKFRLQREEVQNWNQSFWLQHNNNFYKQKQDYIHKSTQNNECCSPEKKALTSEEMSSFYKDFLDKNWEIHHKYNMEWYKKNFQLLLLSCQVKWDSIIRSFSLKKP